MYSSSRRWRPCSYTGERLLGWITQSEGQQGVERVGSGDESWTAFLKEHPELTDC
jgi:hypothetical protein